METLSPNIKNYFNLIRWYKPAGTVLLTLPMWAALWSAAQGFPSVLIFILFTLGAFLTRSFGCIINDLCDRDIDGAVARTKNRPLASGVLSLQSAVALLAVLILLSAGVVFFCHPLVIVLAVMALPIIVIYPLSKRFFKIPQLILGLAFSWSVPMSYAAVLGDLSRYDWPFLMLAVAAWVTAFDTQYALSDLEDDKHLNIYTAPKTLQSYTDHWIIACHVVVMISLLLWALTVPMMAMYSKSIGFVLLALAFVWQYFRGKAPDQGQRLFLHNQWWGVLLWLWVVSISLEHHGLF